MNCYGKLASNVRLLFPLEHSPQNKLCLVDALTFLFSTPCLKGYKIKEGRSMHAVLRV